MRVVLVVVVVNVIEEPVDDAPGVVVGVPEQSFGSNNAVSPDEGKPKDIHRIVDYWHFPVEYMQIRVALETEFAEPEQRRRMGRRSRGYGQGGVAIAVVVAVAVGESAEEVPKGGVDSS